MSVVVVDGFQISPGTSLMGGNDDNIDLDDDTRHFRLETCLPEIRHLETVFNVSSENHRMSSQTPQTTNILIKNNKPTPPPKPVNISEKLKRRCMTSPVTTEELTPQTLFVSEPQKYDTLNNNLTSMRTDGAGCDTNNNTHNNVVVLTINGSNESEKSDIKRDPGCIEHSTRMTGSMTGVTGSKIPILASSHQLIGSMLQTSQHTSDNNLAHKVYLNIDPGKVEQTRNSIKMRRSNISNHIVDTPGVRTHANTSVTSGHVPRSLTPGPGSMIPRPVTPVTTLRCASPSPVSSFRRYQYGGSCLSLVTSGRNTPVQPLSLPQSRWRPPRRGSVESDSLRSVMSRSAVSMSSSSISSKIPVIKRQSRQSLYSSSECLEVADNYLN